jgi:hypothetical protein
VIIDCDAVPGFAPKVVDRLRDRIRPAHHYILNGQDAVLLADTVMGQ